MLKSRDWGEGWYRKHSTRIRQTSCRTCCIPRSRCSDEGCRAGCAATVLSCCCVGRLQAPALALFPRGFSKGAANRSCDSRIRGSAFVRAPGASVPENAGRTGPSAKDSTVNVVFIDWVILNKSIQVQSSDLIDWITNEPFARQRIIEAPSNFDSRHQEQDCQGYSSDIHFVSLGSGFGFADGRFVVVTAPRNWSSMRL